MKYSRQSTKQYEVKQAEPFHSMLGMLNGLGMFILARWLAKVKCNDF